jgi:hypothetical protein
MPQRESSIIRTVVDPTIVLDSLEVYDLDTGTSEVSRENKTEGQIRSDQISKDIGTNYPFIEINNYVFSISEIEFFEIDYTGYIPTARLTAGVKGKTFPSAAMPKDGDLMSVFIRSKNDAFKPIRNDYRITGVRSEGANDQGMNAIYNITGELFIPHLYDEVSSSYQGSSFEVLKEIAKSLGLGFSTNETETSDSQVWINPRGDYYNLIQNIAAHSWKNEDSFYQVWIDIYYTLNFVNVNNQFSEDTNLDLQLLTNMITSDSTGGKTNEDLLKEGTGAVPKVLSNFTDLRGTPAYVFRYNVKNNSNFIDELYGYKIYSQFFEQNSEKYWSIYTEPITTPESEGNKIILKGRTTKPGSAKEEFYKTQVRHVWEGIQYTAPEGNCHEKYNFAKNWNSRNLAELEKMYVTIDLERGNFNLYRGERVPLLLVVDKDIQYQNIMSSPEQPQNSAAFPQPIIDRFYSGYYMISGMQFRYSPRGETNSYDMPTNENPITAPGFTHKVTLTRREWPTPL